MKVPKGLPKEGLQRYPARKNELLQAWDSADELLIEHMSEHPLEGKRILIAHDAFGALTSALRGLDLTVYTDSYLSAEAIRLNAGVAAVHHFGELTGPYDLALIKIPKNLSFFEDILAHLAGRLGPRSKVVCGYMIKHQSKTSFDLLAQYIGETSTSLARKKARLIFADLTKTPRASPYPLRVEIEGFAKPFVNHSNLFSREKLDIGTRFLLEHLPQGDYRTILDLGCANGIIGIAAKRLNPRAQIVFSDESAMAIESARANYAQYFDDNARFLWTHACSGLESADLVLCNPPFHQGNTVGDFTAGQMFTDAYRVLTPGGVLRVIGNSHLKHQFALKKIFGNFEIVAKNSKFTIIDAVK